MRKEELDDDRLAKICAVLGLKSELKRRLLHRKLQDLQHDVELYKTVKCISAPCRIRDRLCRVESHCLKALQREKPLNISRVKALICRCPVTEGLLRFQAALRADSRHPERALRDGRAADELRKLLSDPKALLDAATAARHPIEEMVGTGHAMHEMDPVYGEVFEQLCQIYSEIARKEPAIPVNKDGPGGEFVAFMELCLPLIGWHHKSRDALRHDLRGPRARISGDVLQT